jgi:hypothetical protein
MPFRPENRPLTVAIALGLGYALLCAAIWTAWVL